MGKAARLAERTRRENSPTAKASARPVVVPVEPGYPELGWRGELAALDAKRLKIQARQNVIVAQALAAGVTYSEVARALGKSRQAVHAQFRRLRPTIRLDPPSPTPQRAR